MRRITSRVIIVLIVLFCTAMCVMGARTLDNVTDTINNRNQQHLDVLRGE